MRTPASGLLLAGLFLLATAAGGLTDQNKGAEEIQMPGGSRGEVPFPHLKHQNTLGDCNVCHTLFPQVRGGIEQLKADGKLKPKQVMNKHCIKCHRTEKRAGNPTGPLTCARCHVR